MTDTGEDGLSLLSPVDDSPCRCRGWAARGWMVARGTDRRRGGRRGPSFTGAVAHRSDRAYGGGRSRDLHADPAWRPHVVGRGRHPAVASRPSVRRLPADRRLHLSPSGLTGRVHSRVDAPRGAGLRLRGAGTTRNARAGGGRRDAAQRTRGRAHAHHHQLATVVNDGLRLGAHRLLADPTGGLGAQPDRRASCDTGHARGAGADRDLGRRHIGQLRDHADRNLPPPGARVPHERGPRRGPARNEVGTARTQKLGGRRLLQGEGTHRSSLEVRRRTLSHATGARPCSPCRGDAGRATRCPTGTAVSSCRRGSPGAAAIGAARFVDGRTCGDARSGAPDDGALGTGASDRPTDCTAHAGDGASDTGRSPCSPTLTTLAHLWCSRTVGRAAGAACRTCRAVPEPGADPPCRRRSPPRSGAGSCTRGGATLRTTGSLTGRCGIGRRGHATRTTQRRTQATQRRPRADTRAGGPNRPTR